MKPSIQSVSPAAVGAAGGELVQIAGPGIGPRVAVTFGARPAEVLAILPTGDFVAVDVRAPASEAGPVSIVLQNLAPDGSPIEGETASAPFRFLRALLGVESDLTRLVRVLLRALKSQVIANAATPVSLDYREQITNVIPIAKVPSLTVLGPDLRENRVYATNETGERAVTGPAGPEIELLRPPTTVDLRFVLEVVTNTTAEHLNLFTALVNFFHRNPYLTIERDGRDPSAGTVRFPLFAEGEARTAHVDDTRGRKDDRHTFEWGLVVRGFSIDDHIATGRAQTATGVSIGLRPAVASAGEPS
jgi:hypothetical protein